MSDAGGSGRTDLDRLAARAVDAVLALVARGAALARGVLIFAVVFGGGGFVLGLAALSNGIETVWIVVGGGFALLAIWAAVTAMLRLRAVRRASTMLIGEVRELIGANTQSERTVIETVESADRSAGAGVVVMSRNFSSLRDHVGDRAGQFKGLALAISAITSFPGLIALALLVSFVFVGLSVLFLIALAI